MFKGMPVNAVLVSFNIITGDMTEASQWKKQLEQVMRLELSFVVIEKLEHPLDITIITRFGLTLSVETWMSS